MRRDFMEIWSTYVVVSDVETKEFLGSLREEPENVATRVADQSRIQLPRILHAR